MKTPLIAIHGVGPQKPGEIAAGIDETLSGTKHQDRFAIHEFNWDSFVEQSSQKEKKDFLWFLEASSERISVASRIGLKNGDSRLDRWLGESQFHLNRICQWIIALSVALLLASAFVPICIALIVFAAGLPFSYDSFAAAIRTIVSWSGQLLGVLSLLILIAGVFRSLLAGSASRLYDTIRSLFILYLHPVLVFLSGTFAIKWSALAGLVWFFGGVFFLLSAGIHVYDGLQGRESEYGEAVFLLGVALIVATILVVMERRLADRWFGIVVKILLDIVRYLGDPAYRLSLLDGLDERLEQCRQSQGPEGQTVIVAHSLGSVIAVDSLLNSNAWRRSDDVCLVTMGSPLRRIFQRFFPALLFPDSTAATAKAIAARLGSFRWINVHRPLDYIGTSIGLSKARIGVDASTRQFDRAHADYWTDRGDDRVLSTVMDAAEAVEPVASAHAAGPRHDYQIPNPPRRESLVERLRDVAPLAGAGAFLIVLIGSLFWVAESLGTRDAAVLDRVERLTVEGTTVDATVHYDLLTVGGGYSYTSIHRFRIRFTDPETKQAREVSLLEYDESDVFNEHFLRFDERALAKFIRSHCRGSFWKFWEDGIPCEADEIRFRYLEDDTEFYDFPDFLPSDIHRGKTFGWIRIGLTALVVSIFSIGPFLVFGMAFMLLLGHAPVGRQTPPGKRTG